MYKTSRHPLCVKSKYETHYRAAESELARCHTPVQKEASVQTTPRLAVLCFDGQIERTRIGCARREDKTAVCVCVCVYNFRSAATEGRR